MLDVRYFLTFTAIVIVYGLYTLAMIYFEQASRKTAKKMVFVLTVLGMALVIWFTVAAFLHWWGACCGDYSCWVWG